MEGTTFGRYRLLDVVGRGGMGEVWRAFDTATQRIVAIKVLPPHLAGDAEFRERFQREAKSAAALSEPHVVPIYDFGEIDGRMYVAMQLVHGHNLEALLAHGPLEPARAVGIVEQIAAALSAAHRAGLIHRDVKPSNILVTEGDFAYLIDFGIARAAGQTGLTRTGATIGTMEYMAPERFTSGFADARADIYALTCVLYQALTGQPPFPASSIEQVIHDHLLTQPPRPSQANPHLSAALDRVIETGMAKDPADRYATTRELAQAARAALGASPHYPAAAPTVLAYPTAGATHVPQDHPQHPPKPERRKRVTLIATGCVIAVAIAAGIATAVQASSGDRNAPNPRTITSTGRAAPPVGEDAIFNLLIVGEDLGHAIKSPRLITQIHLNAGLTHTVENVEPSECLALDGPAQDAVYGSSGYKTASVWDFADMPGTPSIKGAEAVVLFPTAERAAVFYQKSARQWSACGSEFSNRFGERAVGKVTNVDHTLSVGIVAPAGNCGRALSFRNNVVADVLACGSQSEISWNGEESATNLVRQIIANVPE